MIQTETVLKVTDNTGAKKAKCIKIYKGKSAKIGDVIQVSVKVLKKKLQTKVKKGSTYKAIIIRTKFNKKIKLNNYINFTENSIILLNNQEMPIGTRILGPVPLELRRKKKLKIISMSSNFI